MNSTLVVRVLFLSCVWHCCRGLGTRARAEQPTNDGTYQVQRKSPSQTVGNSNVSVCLAQVSPPPMNVRFQSLKTSKGAVYTRQLVTAAGIACFENSRKKNLTSATNIGNCANAAAGEGMNSFRFEGGVCTGFLAWRPQVRADCQDGGTTLIYVAQEPLTPFSGLPPINLVGSVRYDIPSAKLVISHDSQNCVVVDNKGFKLVWNGTEVAVVPEGVLEYNLDRRLLCYISTNISLFSIGTDGEVNSGEVIVHVSRRKIYWFGLSTGDCLYHNTRSTELNYDNSDQFCQRLGASLFFEKTEGDFLAFADAWKAYLDQHPMVSDENFYVGLTYDTDQSKWLWTSRLEQTSSGVWLTNEPTNSAVQKCADVYRASTIYRLRTGLCNETMYPGCFVKLQIS